MHTDQGTDYVTRSRENLQNHYGHCASSADIDLLGVSVCPVIEICPSMLVRLYVTLYSSLHNVLSSTQGALH